MVINTDEPSLPMALDSQTFKMLGTRFSCAPALIAGIVVILLVFASGCGPPRPSLEGLVRTNPEEVIAQQDTLLRATGDQSVVVPLLVQAHLNLAERAQKQDDWETAQQHYAAVVKLDGSNKPARYALALHTGQVLYQKGDRSALWDAIEQFSQAATLYPERGAPHYWMALAYAKEDEQDFELILESLDRALARELSIDQRHLAEQMREETLKKKTIYENFWK